MGWHAGRGGWQDAGWAGWGSSSDWAALGDGGDAARSQRRGKGKGKDKRPVTLPLAPQTAAGRMGVGQSYLNSEELRLSPEQLILHIADGDWQGMATWLHAPLPLQIAFRRALKDGRREFQFAHEYGSGTHYLINFDTMTSTNPDSGTVRAIRVSAAVMW